ncbi:MAG: dienelactone hydrolase family protein [Longimicrobiales bacterium]
MRLRAMGFAATLVLIAGCANSAPATAQDPLPADAESALARLNSSPRHAEWTVIRTGDADSVRAFVVYPESSEPAPVVLVVHEIFGLTNWVRAVADQLAADGFIAIAPDLLTMENIPADSSGDPDRQQATQQIRTLDVADVHRQLSAVADWGMALPAATDSYGIVGYCWGGSTSFRHAVESDDVDAAVVYYGSSPDTTMLAQIDAPVLGLYGGNDERVNATIPAAQRTLDELGRTYEVHIFDGAGHGFLRQQSGQEGANMAATREAWPLTVAFFREHLH